MLGQISWIKPTDVPVELLFWFLIGITLAVLAILYICRRYAYFKKVQILQEEMKALELENGESQTLESLVKRYMLNEPVEILYSLRLFDDLALKEMGRILGSPLSQESKKKYIDMLYLIRQKTYFPGGAYSQAPVSFDPSDLHSALPSY
ncbi:MAG: hypothetical protein AB1656_23920 [Candidatus Omnitrophota bacterium]